MDYTPSQSPVNGDGFTAIAVTFDKLAGNAPKTDTLAAPVTFIQPVKEFFKVGNKEQRHLSPIIGRTGHAIYQCLRSYANAKMQAWPSVNTIAAEIGAHPSTVYRIMPLLEQACLIRKENRTTELGDADNNLYTLLHPALWRLDLVDTPSARRHAKMLQNARTGSRKKRKPVVAKSDTNKTFLSEQNEEQQQAPTPEPVVVVDVASDQSIPDTATESLASEIAAVGVSKEVAAKIAQTVAPDIIRLQLDCLNDRAPKNPAAMLVDSIRGNWEVPPKYFERIEAAQREENARQSHSQAQADKAAQKATEREESARLEAENVQLDSMWMKLADETKARIESQAIERMGVLGRIGNAQAGLLAMRRNLLREQLRDVNL